MFHAFRVFKNRREWQSLSSLNIILTVSTQYLLFLIWFFVYLPRQCLRS